MGGRATSHLQRRIVDFGYERAGRKSGGASTLLSGLKRLIDFWTIQGRAMQPAARL
jgi:hypothetical protein